MKRRTLSLIVVLVALLIGLMYFDFFQSSVEKETNFTPPNAPKTDRELKVMPSKTSEPNSDSTSEVIKPLS